MVELFHSENNYRGVLWLGIVLNVANLLMMVIW